METSERERKLNPDNIYKGYCIDLMHKLQDRLHFHVDLHIGYDGFYGARDPVTMKWNGMVGELVDYVSKHLFHFIHLLKRSIQKTSNGAFLSVLVLCM